MDRQIENLEVSAGQKASVANVIELTGAGLLIEDQPVHVEVFASGGMGALPHRDGLGRHRRFGNRRRRAQRSALQRSVSIRAFW